jgi:hypothetical protein
MIFEIVGGAVIGTLIGGAIKGLKDSMYDSRPSSRSITRRDPFSQELMDFNTRESRYLDKPKSREVNILSRKHLTDTENKNYLIFHNCTFIQHAHFHLKDE